jgi:hypothetical protein
MTDSRSGKERASSGTALSNAQIAFSQTAKEKRTGRGCETNFFG